MTLIRTPCKRLEKRDALLIFHPAAEVVSYCLRRPVTVASFQACYRDLIEELCQYHLSSHRRLGVLQQDRISPSIRRHSTTKQPGNSGVHQTQ